MKRLYGVYDVKAEDYIGSVMTFAAHQAAIRTFGDVLADPKSSLHAHVQDYELHHLGDLESPKVGVVPVSPPAVILSGEQWLAVNTPAEGQGVLPFAKEA